MCLSRLAFIPKYPQLSQSRRSQFRRLHCRRLADQAELFERYSRTD